MSPGDVALRPRCVKNPLPSSFRVVSSSSGGGVGGSVVAIWICEFWAGTRQTPRQEKFYSYLSIRSVEVALICRSNNKLSFDALYLYMVKTYDQQWQICFPSNRHLPSQGQSDKMYAHTTHHTPRPFWMAHEAVTDQRQDRSESQ